MQTTSAAPQAKLLAAYAAPEILFALCMDRRQGTLYGGGTSAAVHTAAVNSQEKAAAVAWTNHRNYISGLAFVAGAAFDDVVVSAGFDRQLVWTRACDGVPVRALVAHDAWIRDLALFPDGSRLATVGDDMRLKVWETATGRLIHVLEGHSRQTPQGYATSLYCVAVSPDGHYLASGDRIGEVCLWEAATGKLLQRLKTPEFYTYDAARRVRSIGGIRSVAFSADGRRLAVAGIGQVTNVDGFVGPCRVEVWDWQAPRREFVGQDDHKAVLNHVAFHPTGPWICAVGGGDGGGILALWNGTDAKPVLKTTVKGHLQEFCFDAVGSRLFAAGYGGFQVWDLTYL